MKIQSILETIKEKYLGKEIELYKNKDSVGYYISHLKQTNGDFETIILPVIDIGYSRFMNEDEFKLIVNWNNENWKISLYSL